MVPRFVVPMLVACLSLCTACEALDTPDHVKDLRMLAVRAEPPEQQLVPAALQMTPGAQTTATVQLSVLIADPNGAGRAIDYALSTCARLDTDDRNCSATSAGFARLASGTTSAPTGDVTLTLSFAVPDALLALALQQDPYHGAQGLWLPVQLELVAGGEQVVGQKLLVYTLATGEDSFVANANPNLLGISVGETLWDSETPFVFSASGVPKDGYIINPIFDATAEQFYDQPTFSGLPRRTQEAWLVDYFTTWGGMTPTTAGGVSPLAASQTLVPAAAFKPPKDAALGPGLFWFVVRDGRGGTDWLVRTAQLTP